MACIYPVEVKVPDAGVYLLGYRRVEVPCGRCADCRIVKTRSLAMRIMHEAQMHEYSSFITLTYRPEGCPESVSLRDLQLFNKRLRFGVGSYRYFACAEYGAQRLRPHYHLILFGLDFRDKVLWKLNRRNQPMYRSATLEKAWPHGFSSIGTVTPASAQYVAQYSTKKLSGAHREQYEGKTPEFAIMSTKPGLGATWIDKFKDTVFPRDFVVVADGQRAKVPLYYLRRQPEAMQAIVKADRLAAALRARDELHAGINADDPQERLGRAKAYHAARAGRARALNHRITSGNDLRSYENDPVGLRDS